MRPARLTLDGVSHVLNRAAWLPSRPLLSAVAPAAWLALIVAAVLAGRAIGDDGSPLYLGAAPFAGEWDLRGGARVLLPAVVGGAGAIVLPRVAIGLRWRPLLLVGVLVSAAWAVSLALVDGTSALTAPLTTEFDYLADLPRVRDLGVSEFVRTFTDRIGDYAVHTRGHPPGFVILASSLDVVGLGSAGAIAALCVLGGASATAAAAVVVRVVSSEEIARRAIPFLALAPAAIWMATSADSLYLGIATWGLALLALASARRRVAAGTFAGAGGALLAVGLHFSYGIAPLGLLAVALLVRRRDGRVLRLVAGAGGVAAVTAVFAAAGFRWWEGLAATREQWALGVGPDRPQAYFLVANLAALAAAVGPAAVTGLTRLRAHRGLALLVLGATAAVTVANLSGLSRGEVERIWLPFTPWLVAAAAALDRRRGWLGVQVLTALALQTALVSKW